MHLHHIHHIRLLLVLHFFQFLFRHYEIKTDLCPSFVGRKYMELYENFDILYIKTNFYC